MKIHLLAVAGAIALSMPVLARAQALETTASDAPAQTSTWYPGLGARVHNTAASARAKSDGYDPANAGYVFLEVTPFHIEKAAFCGDRHRQKRLVDALDKAWKDFVKAKTTWGAGVQMWYASTDPAKPDLDRAPLAVSQFSDARHCAPESDDSVFGSPLVPLTNGVQPLSAKVVSWRLKTVDKDQIGKVLKGVGWVADLAGVPAAASKFALGPVTQDLVLDQLNTEVKPGDRVSFAPESVDPEKGGGRVVDIYLGVEPRDMDTWNPSASTDPRLRLRLVTIGSVFRPGANTYPDLKAAGFFDLFDNTRWNGKTLRAYVETIQPPLATSMRTASSTAVFDAQCGQMRVALTNAGALSPTDVEVVLYGLALENSTLTPQNGPITATSAIAASRCLRLREALLGNVGITIPAYRTDPVLVAATNPEMTDAMLTFSTVGDFGSPEIPAGLKAVFGPKLTLLDPKGLLGGDQMVETSGGDAAAEYVRTTFGKAGCWMALAPNQANLRPPGMAAPEGAVTLSAAIGRLQDDRPIVLMFQFSGHEAGKPVQIAAVGIDDKPSANVKAAFKAHYSGSTCGAASVMPSVFE